MTEQNSAALALLALAKSGKGRTKMSRLRELLPYIDAAQAIGVTHKHIRETLTEQGLELSEKAYSVMLFRARQQVAKAEVPKSKPVSNVVEEGGTTDVVMKKAEVPAIPHKTNPAVSPEANSGEPAKFDWKALQGQKPDW